MKIWYQSTLDFDHHPNYGKALRNHFARVASPGTEVVLKGRDSDLGRGLMAPDVIGSPIVYHSIVAPVFVRAVMAAEKDGAKAFIVGSFSEPILPELRSLATIPIVSMAEATFLAAASVAPAIGLVTLNALVVPLLVKSIALHKFKERISGIGIVPGNIPEHELEGAFAKPRPYLEHLIAAVREQIAKGAQAVIPAEGVLGVLAAENGLTNVDGVPIIDAIGTPVLFAEFAVALAERTGVMQSRAAYPLPSPQAMKVLAGIASS
ncbi:MAG: hypothetical protein IT565_01605 [Rhodospirillales bacterium]|nr:hypothetical protein [Rhodospirillales bacterium]